MNSKNHLKINYIQLNINGIQRHSHRIELTSNNYSETDVIFDKD